MMQRASWSRRPVRRWSSSRTWWKIRATLLCSASCLEFCDTPGKRQSDDKSKTLVKRECMRYFIIINRCCSPAIFFFSRPKFMRLNASTMAEGANYGLKRSSEKKVGLTDEGRTKQKCSVRRPANLSLSVPHQPQFTCKQFCILRFAQMQELFVKLDLAKYTNATF